MKNYLVTILASFLLLFLPILNFAQAPNLGTASPFALFTGTGAFNGDPGTTVTGDIGTNTGGFTPVGVLIGSSHVADAIAVSAANAVGVAFGSFPGGGAVIGVGLGGQILTSGVYSIGAAATLNGVLTLNAQGNSNAIFIIKIGGALSTSANSSVLLINGASPCNVYWQVDGAVELGTNSSFSGTIVASGAISLLAGADLYGRGLSTAGAISTNGNLVVLAIPPTASTITAGSATTFCAGMTVTLSGNIGGVWNTGSSDGSITVGTGGTYFVTNTTICGSVTSNQIMVTVGSAPSCTISGGGTICEGSSTQLCAPAGYSSYLWSTGGTTNCISVSTAGTYSVTVTNNGCSSICSTTVSVNPVPGCTITGAGSICEGLSTQLCAPAGASGYLWNTGNTTRCITVSAAGTYSVTVTNNGCSSICSKIITVNPVPACAITGAGSICEGSSTQLCAPAGSSSYLWSTGSTSNCITVNATGTYSVTVTNNGCSSICSKTVTVIPLGACTITGSGSICQGTSTQLCVPAGATGYLWSTGSTSNCIMVSTAGTYSVTVTNSGCVTTCSKVVTVNPVPACEITGVGSICQGQSTQLCVPAGSSSYLWSTGATTNCISVSVAGTYNVTITGANGCTSSCSKVLIVHPLPSCAITGPGSVCLGLPAQLCAPAGSSGYLWSTGGTSNCITVNTAGTYSVTVTNGGGCTSICSKIVTLDSPPTVSTITASDTTSFCQPGSVTLSGNVGGVWNTGATTPSIVVTTSGEYFVTTTNSCATLVSNKITVNVLLLPVTSVITSNRANDTICLGDSIILSGNVGGIWNNGSTATTLVVKNTGTFFVTNSNLCDTVTSNIINIQVDSLPSASVITAIGSTNFCVGDSVILTGNIGGIWNTGATTTSITVKTSGDYFVTQLFSCDSGISNHIQVQVKTKTNPISRIINLSTICVGDSITITGNNGGVWNTGQTTPTIVVKNPGIYFVVNENACDSIGLNTVTELTVLLKPEAPPVLQDTICLNDEIILGNTFSPGHSYKWTTNYGKFISTEANPTVRPTGTTTYILEETNGECQATNSVKITVGPLPSCLIKGNNIICEGGSTELCAPAGAYTYKWSTGETTRCITVDSLGYYIVEVTNSFGCSSRCGRQVIRGEGPCDIVGSGLIYKGQSTQFCAPAGYKTYAWSSGETTQCITVKTAGTYSLTVTNAMGCVSICSKILTVEATVYCEIIGDTLICPDTYATLCAVSRPGNTYYWNNGQTTQCIEINCQGTYSVQITNTSANGKVSNICVIKVKNAPLLPRSLSHCIISGNLNPAQGQTTTLCAPAGYLKYLWSNGATTSCITVSNGGTYAVRASNGGGCSHTCQVNVVYPSSNINTLENRSTELPGVSHLKINAYPNPFNNVAHFEFQTDQTGSLIKVEVTGLAGNKIFTLFDGKAEKGQIYKVSMDGHSMAEGVYLYRIINGSQSITKKIVLIR